MKKNILNRSLFILTIVLVAFLFMKISGYAFSESSAIALNHTDKSDEILYSKKFGKISLLIVREGFTNNLIEVKRNWLGLYKVSRKIKLHPSETDKMNRTWSSHSYHNNKYETIIAAEILDSDVKKVILSNGDMSLDNINEIKTKSTFYRELVVDDGYIVHYEITNSDDTTSYIFRLIDGNENIIYTGY